jgi:hypothetical protein
VQGADAEPDAGLAERISPAEGTIIALVTQAPFHLGRAGSHPPKVDKEAMLQHGVATLPWGSSLRVDSRFGLPNHLQNGVFEGLF